MKKHTPKLVIVSLIMITIIIFTWYSKIKNNPITKSNKDQITIQLQWFDGPQFIGLYVAINKGFFEKENIKVNLLSGSYAINPFNKLKDQNVDIAIATGDQILIRQAQGEKFKVFATVFNKSMACFMTKKDKIFSFNEIIGKKVGVYKNFDTENILLSMLKQQKINTNSVNIVDAGSIEAFFNDEIDFFPSYRFNEPITALLRDEPVNVFYPENYGVTFYSDTYFCEESFWLENRDLLKRFLNAAKKGWKYSKDNPSESIDILYKTLKVLTPENRIKISKELDVIFENIGSGNNNTPLHMEREKWVNMENNLFQIGKIKNKNYVDELCDFELINTNDE